MDILAYVSQLQGNVLAIACSDGRRLNTTDWSELVDFLLEPADLVVCQHIDRFAEDILAVMPEDIASKMRNGGKEYLPDHTKLYYRSFRVFGVTFGKYESNVYGLSRYEKFDSEVKDPAVLLELAQNVVKAFNQKFGVRAKTLASPIAVYSDVLDNLSFGRAGDLPVTAKGLIKESRNIMNREWRSVYTTGRYSKDEVTYYDITAAYPSIMAALPELRHSEFFEADAIPADFTWGVVKGKLRIDKPVSPFDGTGEREAEITTSMLKTLRKHGIGDMKVEKGWFVRIKPNPPLPFQRTMERLYRLRSDPDPLVGRIAKAISVGIGGMLKQSYDRKGGVWLGDNFQSIYGAMISSTCAERVCDFIYSHLLDEEVMLVQVDGVMAKGSPLVQLGGNVGMGCWRVSEPSDEVMAELAGEKNVTAVIDITKVGTP